MNKIGELLSKNRYPGRGIAMGLSVCGRYAAAAYFIMGRSQNSRNRVFKEQPDGIRTRAFDESLMKDPSLIIYHPVRRFESRLIVTNGDQTDTVRDFFMRGRGFCEALRERSFEPDAPNYTPRISGVQNLSSGAYALSILKADGGSPPGCRRYFFEYADPTAGIGHFIHTYRGDGDPLPPFEGEPIEILIPADMEGFSNEIWNALDAENRVSLFVSFTDRKNGESKTKIVNKYGGGKDD